MNNIPKRLESRYLEDIIVKEDFFYFECKIRSKYYEG